MSVDRDLILKTIYDPIFPGVQLLQCGLWVPTIGKWCDDTTSSTNSYDPAAAEKLLTDDGWTKGADGIWAEGRQRARRSAGWSTPATSAVRTPRP